MSREERNRKISELRGHQIEDGECIHGCFTRQQTCVGTDWHADANWPTLLREMPEPLLLRNVNQSWTCHSDHTLIHQAVEATEADAVCSAWLKWKAAK